MLSINKFQKEFEGIRKNAMRTGVLDLEDQTFQEVYIILQFCGYSLHKFIWSYDEEEISQTDFIRLLNLMPNLTKLKLFWMKLKEEENPKKKLKLDLDIFKNLKSVECDDESVLSFFSSNFAKYFKTKVSLGYCADYEELTEIKSPQTELIKKIVVWESLEKQGEIKEIFKFLNLEQLTISIDFKEDFIKAISTLKNLRKLKFDECYLTELPYSWKCLEDLENLESLIFHYSKFNALFLRDLKLKSLKKLSVTLCMVEGHDFISEDLLINLPNLKVLKSESSSQKINFYAKHFKTLEKLHLGFEHQENLIEFDTGIVNENLKELKISYDGIKDEVNDLLEIVEIFPNLESIDFEIEWCYGSAPLFANKFLFKRLNKLKNLKSLKCDNLIYINRCLDFIVDGELIDDLKSLSKKLKLYDFGLKVVSDKVIDYKKVNVEDGYSWKEAFPLMEIEKENFKLFVTHLKKFFEVDCDERTCKLLK